MKRYHVHKRGPDWFVVYADEREAFAEVTRMGSVLVRTFDTNTEAQYYVDSCRRPRRPSLLDQMNEADEYGSGWWVS